MEYALRRPPGLMSLVLASAPSSMRRWTAEADRLRQLLPAARRQRSEHNQTAVLKDVLEEAL
jgi:hypothetical protein